MKNIKNPNPIFQLHFLYYFYNIFYKTLPRAPSGICSPPRKVAFKKKGADVRKWKRETLRSFNAEKVTRESYRFLAPSFLAANPPPPTLPTRQPKPLHPPQYGLKSRARPSESTICASAPLASFGA